MDKSKNEFMDNTVLNTPKPTACSTVNRSSAGRRNRICPTALDNTLDTYGAPQLPDGSSSLLGLHNSSNMNSQLEQQRLLANNSLQRATKVSGIPSKYFRPNSDMSSLSNLNLTTESTVNESDLLKSPKDTSTPRSSCNFTEGNQSRLSLVQSLAELSYKIRQTDMSIDNFADEFHKAMKGEDKNTHSSIQSDIFKPAEDAASMLFADEISWRKKNDIPALDNFSQLGVEDVTSGDMSVGAFFRQRSDTLSDLRAAISPEKKKPPTPLIDASISSFAEPVHIKNENISKNKSLSISTIQRFLAETDDTPRKAINYLLCQQKSFSDKETDNSLLPLSKDSSYTSNYSDNEALKCIVENKENIQDNEQQILSQPSEIVKNGNRSSSQSSTRTSSSLTNLPDGKLPIESTKVELVWGCVKVDKCITQDFVIRNKTPKRLGVHMSVSGHEFKIRKDGRQECELMSSVKVVLHPHESRSIHVSFIPTKIGAAIDKLSFTSLDPTLQQTRDQYIRLYGYGGHGNVNLENITKDISGKFWLSLGKLDNRSAITKSFFVKNTGTLPTFTYISFNSKELFAFANISVIPAFLVLTPKEEKEVVISYLPTSEDHKNAHQLFFTNTLVADIGSLVVLSGTEANRGRLRRICRKSIEKGLALDPLSNILKETFRGEVIPSDITLFKETPNALKEILKLFTRSEIVLTLEQDPEQTIIPQYPDESSLFQTLCQETTVVSVEASKMGGSCRLEPTSIILIPPNKIRDCFFLISESDKVLHYEVACSPLGLEISPSGGVLRPGEQLVLDLHYPRVLPGDDKKFFKVSVYVDNEVYEASVKVVFIHGQDGSKKK